MTETIGQQLKRVRESRYLTIQKVVEETRIRAHYLEAMEADNFEALPSPAQARGFLRIYADFLGLSLEEVIARRKHESASLPETAGEVSPPPPSVLPEEPDKDPPPPVEAGAKAVKRRKKPARKEQLPEEPLEKAQSEEPSVPPLIPLETGPEKTSRPPAPSQSIFTSIGTQLRGQREALSLTLEEVERHTHVRKHYLQIMEAGEFDQLPSSVQARGMLNNYAHFLEMDVDGILLKFAEGLQAQLVERQPAVPASETGTDTAKSKISFQLPFRVPRKIQLPSFIRRYLSTDLLVGGGLILFLIIFAVWGTSRVISLRSGTPLQPTAPSIADVLITTPVSTLTATPTPQSVSNSIPQPSGSTPVVAVPTGGSGAIQIILVASESSWVRVTTDGKVKFEGRLTAGTAYPYDADSQIEVLTGNGAAISVTYNQNNLGPMGTFGEVVDHIYTVNGILNPTPTFTPTSTSTPVPTWTAKYPTPTSRYSATPSLTPTR